MNNSIKIDSNDELAAEKPEIAKVVEISKEAQTDLDYIESIYPILRDIQMQYNQASYYSYMYNHHIKDNKKYKVTPKNIIEVGGTSVVIGIIFGIMMITSGSWKFGLIYFFGFSILPFIFKKILSDKNLAEFKVKTGPEVKKAKLAIRKIKEDNKEKLSRIPGNLVYAYPINYAKAALEKGINETLEEALADYSDDLENGWGIKIKDMDTSKFGLYAEKEDQDFELSSLVMKEVSDLIKINMIKEQRLKGL